MSLRALALSPSERTADDSDRLRPGDLSGAHPPASAGAPLHAAHPCRDARGHPHHAAARQPARGQGVRAEARRLDRGAAAPPAGGRAVRARHDRAAARRRASHRASSGRARHGVDRDRRRTASACCASPGEAPHVDRRVGDFLRREAQRDLEAASRRAAEKLGVAIKRVSVRDQSSRWGSCSTTGVLSYSWRLILAPPFVLDYLAVHEVAHLVEMNHSPRFWRLVHRLCPDADRAKVWLDVHGTDLHRYGLPDEAAQPRAPAADRLSCHALRAHRSAACNRRRGSAGSSAPLLTTAA